MIVITLDINILYTNELIYAMSFILFFIMAAYYSCDKTSKKTT